MIRSRPLRGERSRVFSPVGFQFMDSFTGLAPIGRVSAFLEIRVGTDWRLTEIEPVSTLSGIFVYPGLGRQNRPTEAPPRDYRVRFDSELYRVAYPPETDSYAFRVAPYNDLEPLNVRPVLHLVPLMPTSVYPFPSQVPVVRGWVAGPSGRPVEGAEVFDGNREKALTDARGVFALPLRDAEPGAVTIFASHDPPLPSQDPPQFGQIEITIPDELTRGHRIDIR